MFFVKGYRSRKSRNKRRPAGWTGKDTIRDSREFGRVSYCSCADALICIYVLGMFLYGYQKSNDNTEINTKGVFFTVFVFFFVDSRNQRDKMQEDMTIFFPCWRKKESKTRGVTQAGMGHNIPSGFPCFFPLFPLYSKKWYDIFWFPYKSSSFYAWKW